MKKDVTKKDVALIHHADRRTDVMMPYAPALLVRRGNLLFLSGVTAAPVYHSHPHRDEEFDLPTTMAEQAVLTLENVKKTLAAVGSTMSDVVSATRYLTNIAEQDDMNRVWARYLDGHLPATTTIEVTRLATHANCKLEIAIIAVAGAADAEPRRHASAVPRAKARVSASPKPAPATRRPRARRRR
jgi:enamine deaminase RidA (YjgF/YER057c/UK114 family)